VSRQHQPRLIWRSAALDPDSGLTSRARLAACVLCEYAAGDGVLDPAPSAETVAGRMGVVERTAQAARRELEREGWLWVERRPGKPSRIVLLTAEPLHEMQGSEGATPARTPAATPANTPATAAPEPENQRTREAGDARAGARARPPSKKELDRELRSRTNSGRRRETVAEQIERAADRVFGPKEDQ
jgi:hypothetical protein